MKRLESKEFFFQTDNSDGQIYLFPANNSPPIGAGKCVLTVISEETTTDTSEPLESKNIYLRKDDQIIGLHAIGYPGPYECILEDIDGARVKKIMDFQNIDAWGNRYNEKYERRGGSFRLGCFDLEDEAREYEAEGWVRFIRP